ncbi:MAG: hypothetical protein MI922_21220, partial [Bacteroidales bacterium]|nr:hypothetical protein [Bacteroidales bacterium]
NKFIGKTGGGVTVINSVIYKPITEGENQGGSGTVLATVFPGSHELLKEKSGLAFDLRPVPGVAHGGYIVKGSIAKAIEAAGGFDFEGLSPARILSAELNQEHGLVGKCEIDSTVPFLNNVKVALIVDSNGVNFSLALNAEDFNLPAPFSVTNTSMEIFAGTKGLGISGDLNFEIQGLGTGKLSGQVATGTGISLNGWFDFDSSTFEPARITVGYTDGQWSVSGEFGIPGGKIKGVKSATIKASYLENIFALNGTADLDIPKTQNASMAISYSDVEGFVIAGTFEIDNSIKGISKSLFNARVSRNPEGEYKVKASGSVTADIPGLKEVTVKGAYDDGLFDLSLTTGYEIGIVSGKLSVGVTNQVLDEEGKPTGEESEELVFYGKTVLDVMFTDNLKGTVEAELTPQGDVILAGEISVPEELPLSKEFVIDPDPLFKFPTVSIPIGPSLNVLGKKIGIFLEFGGDLRFRASLGPVMLKQLSLRLDNFNPQKPEEAVVTGNAALGIAAEAKLTLTLFAGVSLSVLIVEAWGRLNGSASLVLKGEAGGAVELKWTKNGGLELVEAFGELSADVKLLLEVFLSAGVEVDLLLTSFTAWSDRWDVADLEIGTPFKFGMKFPVKTKNNGDMMGIDYSDMDVDRPDFKASSLENTLEDAVDAAQNPPQPPPPSKKEVIQKLKKLDAGYYFDIFNDNDSERRGYLLKLMFKYPDEDWGFALQEIRRLDQQEVEPFARKIKSLPENTNIMWVMSWVGDFRKDHPDADRIAIKKALKEKGFDSAVPLA